MLQYWNIPEKYSGKREIVTATISFEQLESFGILYSTIMLGEAAFAPFVSGLFRKIRKIKSPYNIPTSFGKDIAMAAKDAVNNKIISSYTTFGGAWKPPIVDSFIICGKQIVSLYKKLGSLKYMDSMITRPEYMSNTVLIDSRGIEFNDDMKTGRIRKLGAFTLDQPTLFPSQDNMNHLRVYVKKDKVGNFTGVFQIRCESFVNLKGSILKPELLVDTKADKSSCANEIDEV